MKQDSPVLCAHVWPCNVPMDRSSISMKWLSLSLLTSFSLKSILSDIKGTEASAPRGQCQAPGSVFVVGVCVLEEGGKHGEASGKHVMWGILSGLGMFGVMRRKCR